MSEVSWNEITKLSALLGQPIAMSDIGEQIFTVCMHGGYVLEISINIFELHSNIVVYREKTRGTVMSIPYPYSELIVNQIDGITTVIFLPPTKINFVGGGGCVICPLEIRLTLPNEVEIYFDRDSKRSIPV